MFKIVTIVGARPQFIKAAVVSRAFETKSEIFREIIIHTGQHYDENMSDIFFSELKIPKPTFYLGIGGGSHGKNTGRMLEAIEVILLEEKPDAVVVYGDTDSTLAGALAAAKLHIPVVHIEAGLRSFNKRMPEELNRILTDHLSSLLFAPSNNSIINLEKEGILGSKVFLSGDVMFDAILFYKKFAKKPKSINEKKDFYLATIHRAENTNNLNRLKEILEALQELSKSIPVVLPLHPRTKKIIYDNFFDISNIEIIDPVGYFEMLWLIQNSRMVLTDSGGLQKESYFLMKRCVVLRTETEWIELIQNGWNILAGFDKVSILNSVKKINLIENEYLNALYGEGKSGELIVSKIKEFIIE
jgi:UDP-GlcNAc3NAcA epimerase